MEASFPSHRSSSFKDFVRDHWFDSSYDTLMKIYDVSNHCSSTASSGGLKSDHEHKPDTDELMRTLTSTPKKVNTVVTRKLTFDNVAPLSGVRGELHADVFVEVVNDFERRTVRMTFKQLDFGIQAAESRLVSCYPLQLRRPHIPFIYEIIIRATPGPWAKTFLRREAHPHLLPDAYLEQQGSASKTSLTIPWRVSVSKQISKSRSRTVGAHGWTQASTEPRTSSVSWGWKYSRFEGGRPLEFKKCWGLTVPEFGIKCNNIHYPPGSFEAWEEMEFPSDAQYGNKALEWDFEVAFHVGVIKPHNYLPYFYSIEKFDPITSKQTLDFGQQDVAIED